MKSGIIPSYGFHNRVYFTCAYDTTYEPKQNQRKKNWKPRETRLPFHNALQKSERRGHREAKNGKVGKSILFALFTESVGAPFHVPPSRPTAASYRHFFPRRSPNIRLFLKFPTPICPTFFAKVGYCDCSCFVLVTDWHQYGRPEAEWQRRNQKTISFGGIPNSSSLMPCLTTWAHSCSAVVLPMRTMSSPKSVQKQSHGCSCQGCKATNHTLRNPPEPSGSCIRNLHQHTPEPSTTFRKFHPEPTPAHTGNTGTLRNLPEPASRTHTSTHQHTPEPFGTFRNLPPWTVLHHTAPSL